MIFYSLPQSFKTLHYAIINAQINPTQPRGHKYVLTFTFSPWIAFDEIVIPGNKTVTQALKGNKTILKFTFSITAEITLLSMKSLCSIMSVIV